MKEIDFKTLELLLKKELDILNLKYILIFIAINLIIAVINWLIQRNVKLADNNIYKKKIREDRRLVIIEDIYKELVAYTYILDPKEFIKTTSKTALLERKLSENYIYIGKNLNKKIVDFIDYTKSVASDYRKKDFKRESQLLDIIEKEFNK